MSDMRDDAFGRRLPKSSCPLCGKKLDAASDADGEERPSPGDVTLCIGCGTVFEYDGEMKLRVMTEAELSALEEEVQAQIKTVRMAILHWVKAEEA